MYHDYRDYQVAAACLKTFDLDLHEQQKVHRSLQYAMTVQAESTNDDNTPNAVWVQQLP